MTTKVSESNAKILDLKVSILILAAGNSSRLGSPKQLVNFEGKTLIERITETALSISKEVLIVLGCNEEMILPKLERFKEDISIIFNPKWKEGMGTSISAGVEKLADRSDLILILLSDQPFVSKVLLQNMLQTYASSHNPIVSCVYNGTFGVPMLFDKSIFPELLKLSENKGARSFLHLYENKISTMNFPKGIIDIDTKEDMKQLKSN
jgi:molybdenum cofactor cytidylyltransferase